MDEIKGDNASDKIRLLDQPVATLSDNTVDHQPSYLKPVQANEILGGEGSKSPHDRLHRYVTSKSKVLDPKNKRDSTSPSATINIVANAKHVVRQATLDSAHAGVVKDLALMIGAVVDSTQFEMDNSKYRVQKEANRAVWRSLEVKRTGIPGLWRSAKQLFSEPKPAGNLPSKDLQKDLRDILVNMLDQMGKWITPTDVHGAHEPYRPHDRQAKSLNRVDEVLKRIDNPRMQAEVVAKMVEIGRDVPIALSRAFNSIETNPPTRSERKIVFDEVIRLMDGKDMKLLSTALDFLGKEEIMKAINEMPEEDKKELRSKLINEVTSVLAEKYQDTKFKSKEEKEIEKLRNQLDLTRSAIRVNDGSIWA